MLNLSQFLLCWLFLFPTVIYGQEIDVGAKPLPVNPTSDFEITGDGTASSWTNAAWTSITARRGSRSANSTRVKLLYSEKGIYCLFFCQDSQITATLKEDFANLYTEDVVEIFFWPDQSVPVYFEYELSPYNFELAIMVPNLKGRFFGWRPWQYEGDRVTRRGAKIQKDEKGIVSWTAEFFIPFALLKPLLMAPPKKGALWRANMYRIDYDEGSTSWSWKETRQNFHDYEKFGTIEFQ
jgi:Carbohydrate family 9 binding domain-like